MHRQIAGKLTSPVTKWFVLAFWIIALMGLGSFAGKLTSGQSQMPDLKDVVDQYFDFAEKVLAKQREFAQQWASATLKATEAVTEQAQRAQSVTSHTANGTEAVVDNAAETARVASEKAASTLRAARDAANN